MLIQRQTETPAYADVSVLLLRWDDDKSAEQDLADLELVFQKPYGFHTQQWLIPTVPNPGTKLTVQMASFLENARPNHLFIICYVGYGYLSADGHLYWAWFVLVLVRCICSALTSNAATQRMMLPSSSGMVFAALSRMPSPISCCSSIPVPFRVPQ